METRFIFLFAVLLVLTAPLAALADHLPDLVTVYLFDSVPDSTYSTDAAGTLSFGGMTATWAVSDAEADVSFVGRFDSPGKMDVFYVEWNSTPVTMPLSVSFTSTTGGRYGIYPIYRLEGQETPEYGLIREEVTGDTYFGYHFPAAGKISFAVYILDSNVPYDLHVVLDWGLGVPTGAATWDGVKSLFR